MTHIKNIDLTGEKRIELGKQENGVTLFDNENSVKIDIIGLGGLECLVNYDTRNYDLYRGEHAGWFSYQFEVLRWKNPEIYKTFDEFFKAAFYEIVINNREKYERPYDLGSSLSVLHYHGGENFQIQYPSDDTSFEDATRLGITQYKLAGYTLDFEKSLRDLSKLSWSVKQDGGHYPELANLFIKLFLQLNKLATKSYEECQEEFDTAFKTKILKNK